ncbi:uncharacterized protein LOC142898513 [Nelusetta ayraudi]|uniref:uncharacterized protein LOC142898513 n=1 Tax=Nelusetta ayraudi TaxID=303726 RepID=UPI003F704B21
MSVENISLLELLNLSIGTPQRGAVNFNALHVLLHAVLRHLDLQEVTARWEDAPPGHRHSEEAAAGKELRASTEPQPQRTVGSRIRSCEDGVTEALKVIQELHQQTNQLKEEVEQLRSQQKVFDLHVEKVSAVEQCCHRVDALETTVRSLSDSLQTLPEAEQLSGCVTWDVLHSALLRDGEQLQQVGHGELRGGTRDNNNNNNNNCTFYLLSTFLKVLQIKKNKNEGKTVKQHS